MSIKHILLAVVGGIAIVTAATSAQAHTVCDEYGRCWEQVDPGEAIINGIFGHHHDDWDHHHDDWDHHHHHHHHHDEDDED